MNREELISLADKILKKEASEEEIRKYNAWYNSFQRTNSIDIGNAEEKKALLYARIEQEVGAQLKPAHNLWPRYIGIAAAVTAIAFGIWFFKAPGPSLSSGTTAKDLTNDIAPGKNTATLTLSNGKTITLSDAKNGVVVGNHNLSYNDGSALSGLQPSLPKGKSSMTLSTPRGGTYQITLSDGTKVWLNAASSLTYYADLTEPGAPGERSAGPVRRVKLEGEAYFEVAKLKRSSLSRNESAPRQGGRVPFIVESRGQIVEVLGTHFNINSYADEGYVKTTLLEGSVSVTTKLNGQRPERNSVFLRPNQQAAATSTGIKVKDVDAAIAVAWKDHKFMFESERIENIMNMVARWYNVDVLYEGPVPDDKFGGSVSRFENVSKVLKYLESTGSVHFKIEGRQIIVSK